MTARDRVIGRGEELATVGAMLGGVAGGSRGLVLTGEAGVGKTILWRAGVELARARGFKYPLAASSRSALVRATATAR